MHLFSIFDYLRAGGAGRTAARDRELRVRRLRPPLDRRPAGRLTPGRSGVDGLQSGNRGVADRAACRAADLRADRRAARGRALQRRRCPRARGGGRGPSQRRGQGVRRRTARRTCAARRPHSVRQRPARRSRSSRRRWSPAFPSWRRCRRRRAWRSSSPARRT